MSLTGYIYRIHQMVLRIFCNYKFTIFLETEFIHTYVPLLLGFIKWVGLNKRGDRSYDELMTQIAADKLHT